MASGMRKDRTDLRSWCFYEDGYDALEMYSEFILPLDPNYFHISTHDCILVWWRRTPEVASLGANSFLVFTSINRFVGYRQSLILYSTNGCHFHQLPASGIINRDKEWIKAEMRLRVERRDYFQNSMHPQVPRGRPFSYSLSLSRFLFLSLSLSRSLARAHLLKHTHTQ